MNDTPDTRIVAEESQRNTARMAERDAELVAVAAIAFEDGLIMGRAQKAEK